MIRRGRGVRSGCGVEPQRRSEEPPLSPDNRAAPARDDRSARIRTRTREVGARDASGYTTDLDPRFPDALLSARMPVGQCWVARPAGRRAVSGARRRRKPTPVREARERTTRVERASWGWRPVALPSELRPPMRPAGVEPARLPYQSSALH